MKSLRISILAVLLATGFASMAGGEGESAAKPFLTAESMKAGLAENLENFMMKDFNLDDVTVSIEFVINKVGDIALVNVNGDNCIVNTYVQQMLKDKKFYVSDELSNTVHQLTIRYVRI